MARSSWKGCFISKSIYSSLLKSNFFRTNRLNVYSRNSTIPSKFTNFICGIDKGMAVRHIYVRPLYIGHKFGEFAFSRKNYHFVPKEKKTKLRR